MQRYISGFCKKRKIPFHIDDFGNLIVPHSPEIPRPLYFVAHMDHPGFILEKAPVNGAAAALFYGGWDPDEFKAAPIKIFTPEGPVSAKAISWSKATGERARRALLKIEGHAEAGNIGMWDFDASRVEGETLFSRSCDDLAGCALILTTIEHFWNLNKKTLPLGAVFTVAEEAGLHGAKYICSHKNLPRRAIPVSVETSRELPVAKIGDGTVIRVGDSRTIFSPEITAFMVSTAKAIHAEDKEFSFQRKLMDGGQCEASVFSDFGYTCGALSVPLGNYHNRNFSKGTTEPEYVSLHDLESTARLMIEMVKSAQKGIPVLKKKVPVYREECGSLGQKFLL
ncbi:MAG: hypothetical protein GX556_09350 [Fibrobacter sp.]|nr:hypothetical protein [Fibrobacter sp.]